METFIIKAIQLLLSLSILVVVHEFGHFIFARMFGIRVEKFYLFFDPWFSIFKFKPKNSHTEYGIGWLPLGGYVKISGMIDESMDKEQMAQPAKSWEFRSKPAWQRLLVMVAGVLFNFLLAALIFFVIGMLFGVPVEKPYAQFGEIAEGGVAHEAGLKEGDIVRKIDGVPIDSWGEMVEIIRGNPGENLLFEIERDGEIFTIYLAPRDEDGVGIIGVHHPLERSLFVAVPYSIEMTWFYTKQIFIILGNLISEGVSIDDFAGPVGIYASTEVMAQRGLLDLMLWGAVLSINLGIMNLLPIPALDGGRLMFFAIEAIRGKPVPKEKESLVHFLGFALLMLLMLAVTWNDFQRFFIEKNF